MPKWIVSYECPICGELHRNPVPECSFCHTELDGIKDQTGAFLLLIKDCSNEGVYCSKCGVKLSNHWPIKKKYSRFCSNCGARFSDNIKRG